MSRRCTAPFARDPQRRSKPCWPEVRSRAAAEAAETPEERAAADAPESAEERAEEEARAEGPEDATWISQ